jgi:AraC-like DNA-binding protein
MSALVSYNKPGLAVYDPHNGRRYWHSLGDHFFAKRVRTPILQRENVAVLMLRRKGHSITTISGFLGRSTSYVHRVLKFNKALGSISRFLDLRKTLGSSKALMAKRRLKSMVKLWESWEAFILGETDRPP